MAGLLNLLVYLVLIACGIGMLLVGLSIICRFLNPSPVEVILRAMSAILGLLGWAGSKAIGVSIPDLLFQSLQLSSLVVGIVGIILPSVAGYLMASYVIHKLKSSSPQDVLPVRILSLVITFAFFVYADALMASFSASEQGQFKHLLPNLTFVISMLVYIVFKFKPQQADDAHPSSLLDDFPFRAVRNFVQTFAKGMNRRPPGDSK
jgi:hypothetical protein